MLYSPNIIMNYNEKVNDVSRNYFFYLCLMLTMDEVISFFL